MAATAEAASAKVAAASLIAPTFATLTRVFGAGGVLPESVAAAAGGDRRYLGFCQRALRPDVTDAARQRQTLRDTWVSMPAPICRALPADVLDQQHALLAAELAESTVVEAVTLPTVAPQVAIWQGDMAHLRCDAVVNPGNAQLLGCFAPSHRCLDNILHAQAGPRLRVACLDMMERLGIDQDGNGNCRVTDAFSLPAGKVYHTVGPCLLDPYQPHRPARPPTAVDRAELKSCYVRCYQTAMSEGAKSLAFCCISTGIFGYPAEEAAALALTTIKEQQDFIRAAGKAGPLVVFNVFKDEDLAIYTRLAPTVFVTPAVAAEGAAEVDGESA